MKHTDSPTVEKRDYELAEEFLTKLKIENTDTIIFYKRTCINCCDFFNIYWSANGQKRVTKIYFDIEDRRARSKTIILTSAIVFELLDKNYDELKNTSIKGNVHKNKDGTSIAVMQTHYCYAQMKIYTHQDSIVTNKMKDTDFQKYTGIEVTVTNDNYLKNMNSKWNLFLATIENEIANMPETTKRELETLRTKKLEK